MGLFSRSLKGNKEDFSHLQGQPPQYSQQPHQQPPPQHAVTSHSEYGAPSQYPPPATSSAGFSYMSNPPQYGGAPPYPGPPPGYMEYADETTPDAAPPQRSHDSSQANASEQDAVRGHDFCAQYPLYPPAEYTQEQVSLTRRGELGLQCPTHFRGFLSRTGPNITKVISNPDNLDGCLLSNLPVYSAQYDRPVEPGKRTIYFEIKIISLASNNPDSAIAIGFSALPQPPWRMPGWHRGSLSVMSDDGRRFVNDSYGGRDFTQPFKVGETVGLGMRFGSGRAEVFHIRHGDEVGSWWVDEEVDNDDVQYGGITGLSGESDLYAAIGIFGDAEIEVIFHSQS